MKYKLLLGDLLKYTELAKLDDEVALLNKACEVMTVVPKEANDMMNVGRLQGFDVSFFLLHFWGREGSEIYMNKF